MTCEYCKGRGYVDPSGYGDEEPCEECAAPQRPLATPTASSDMVSVPREPTLLDNTFWELVHQCASQTGNEPSKRACDALEEHVGDLLHRQTAHVTAQAKASVDRLADILRRTVNAIRGEPPKSIAWGWKDLPERAAALARPASTQQVPMDEALMKQALDAMEKAQVEEQHSVNFNLPPEVGSAVEALRQRLKIGGAG